MAPTLDLRDRLCRLLRCCPQPGTAVTLTSFPHGEEGGLVTFDPGGKHMLLLTTTQGVEMLQRVYEELDTYANARR